VGQGGARGSAGWFLHEKTWLVVLQGCGSLATALERAIMADRLIGTDVIKTDGFWLLIS